MKILVLFIILSIANVIIQTIKSLATVKCGKGVASIVNAVAYGLYTIVIVYTNADFPLWEKVAITAIVNLIGVYIVKYFEEKMRKDRLWKVQLTVRESRANDLEIMLEKVNIPYNDYNTNDDVYTIFNIYCATQKQSLAVKEIAKQFNAKYFVAESKNL